MQQPDASPVPRGVVGAPASHEQSLNSGKPGEGNLNSISFEQNNHGLENGKPKTRKPYIITKQRERWTDDEHRKFVEALQIHGRAWRKIEEHIGSKTSVQIRSHAQKFFNKVEKGKDTPGSVDAQEQITIPPPRPKRRPVNPYPRKDNGDNSGSGNHGDVSGNNRHNSAAKDTLGQSKLSSGLHTLSLSGSKGHDVTEATVAAVAAAASAAAAAAAAAVVAAAGHKVQAHLQNHPPQGFPFFGVPPSLLAQVTLQNPALESFSHPANSQQRDQLLRASHAKGELATMPRKKPEQVAPAQEMTATSGGDGAEPIGLSDSREVRDSDGDSACSQGKDERAETEDDVEPTEWQQQLPPKQTISAPVPHVASNHQLAWQQHLTSSAAAREWPLPPAPNWIRVQHAQLPQLTDLGGGNSQYWQVVGLVEGGTQAYAAVQAAGTADLRARPAPEHDPTARHKKSQAAVHKDAAQPVRDSHRRPGAKPGRGDSPGHSEAEPHSPSIREPNISKPGSHNVSDGSNGSRNDLRRKELGREAQGSNPTKSNGNGNGSSGNGSQGHGNGSGDASQGHGNGSSGNGNGSSGNGNGSSGNGNGSSGNGTGNAHSSGNGNGHSVKDSNTVANGNGHTNGNGHSTAHGGGNGNGHSGNGNWHSGNGNGHSSGHGNGYSSGNNGNSHNRPNHGAQFAASRQQPPYEVPSRQANVLQLGRKGSSEGGRSSSDLEADGHRHAAPAGQRSGGMDSSIQSMLVALQAQAQVALHPYLIQSTSFNPPAYSQHTLNLPTILASQTGTPALLHATQLTTATGHLHSNTAAPTAMRYSHLNTSHETAPSLPSPAPEFFALPSAQGGYIVATTGNTATLHPPAAGYTAAPQLALQLQPAHGSLQLSQPRSFSLPNCLDLLDAERCGSLGPSDRERDRAGSREPVSEPILSSGGQREGLRDSYPGDGASIHSKQVLEGGLERIRARSSSRLDKVQEGDRDWDRDRDRDRERKDAASGHLRQINSAGSNEKLPGLAAGTKRPAGGSAPEGEAAPPYKRTAL